MNGAIHWIYRVAYLIAGHKAWGCFGLIALHVALGVWGHSLFTGAVFATLGACALGIGVYEATEELKTLTGGALHQATFTSVRESRRKVGSSPSTTYHYEFEIPGPPRWTVQQESGTRRRAWEQEPVTVAVRRGAAPIVLTGHWAFPIGPAGRPRPAPLMVLAAVGSLALTGSLLYFFQRFWQG